MRSYSNVSPGNKVLPAVHINPLQVRFIKGNNVTDLKNTEHEVGIYCCYM